MTKKPTIVRLKEYSKKIKQLHRKFLGYQENQKIQYGDLLHQLGLFEVCLDNLGDPFSDSMYQINSKEFEQEVITFFAEMYELKDYWGYTTACGSEGTLMGAYLGREAYPNGILYYSKDTHYSIAKAAKILRINEKIINSQINGEIEYDDFELKLDPSLPAIINVNIGTTMKGAIDNLDQIERALKRRGITEYYIHCDAALSGMLLPYLEKAPKVNFQKNIRSLSVSGHKFIGAPIPCGIILAHRKDVKKIENPVECLSIIDSTILGSRSGLSPIFLWQAIQERGHTGFRKEAHQCIKKAQYLYHRLQEMNYPSWLNDFSNIVYFKKPSDILIQEWHLSSAGDISHIVAMQHVTKNKINLFLEGLRSDQA